MTTTRQPESVADCLEALAERVSRGEPAVEPSNYIPAIEPSPVLPLRRDHRKLVLLAAHVADEAADVPENVAERVFRDEELLSLELAKVDPEWTKAQEIAEDAWRDQLEDPPVGRSWWWDE